MQPERGVDGSGPRRSYWLWPLRPSPQMGSELLSLTKAAQPFISGWRWPLVALAVGLVPLFLSYGLGNSFHQVLTAVLLAMMLWACLGEDRQGKALAITAVVILGHSALAIFLTAHDPKGVAVLFPDSDRYWEQTYHWIRSGENSDYEPVHWLPAHLVQLAGVLAGGYTSLGLLPLIYGLGQLDVMNYYVGRLAGSSNAPLITVLVGWHPWSFVRGLGFTLLMYEMASWSLERFSGRRLSTPRRRFMRWTVGLGFLVADALLKYLSADWIRQVLNSTLPAE